MEEDVICYQRNLPHYQPITIRNEIFAGSMNFSIIILIKGSTSRAANLILERSGAFWQHEKYDHLVRNDRELMNVIWYVVTNLVKAGLGNDWHW